MSAELQPLVTLLQNSLDPQQHRQAEGQIQQAEGQQGFSIALLRIVGTDEIPQTTRLAAALYFKNLVRRRWVDDQGNYVLPQDEVAQIKHDIVGLMIACPPNIQAQLGEAISEIANTDFFRQWDSLIDVSLALHTAIQHHVVVIDRYRTLCQDLPLKILSLLMACSKLHTRYSSAGGR